MISAIVVALLSTAAVAWFALNNQWAFMAVAVVAAVFGWRSVYLYTLNL